MSFSTETTRSTIILTLPRKEMLKCLVITHSTPDRPRTQNEILNAALSSFKDLPVARQADWIKKGWRG